MKNILLILLLSNCTILLKSQCTVTLSATAASCPTCCDSHISSFPNSPCPPFSYSWEPNDPNWPLVGSGCAGTTYTITITDGCGCTAVGTILPSTSPVDINKENFSDEINLYPNPANTSFEITTGDNQIIKEVELYSMEGKLVIQQKNSECKIIINTSQLPIGMYFLKLQTTKKKLYQKLLISH